VVTLALTILVGVAFGLAPALAATHPDVAPALKGSGSAPLRGYRRFGLRNLLMAYQVASSLMLLLITGFIVLGYGRSANIDPGFDTANLYLLQLDPAHDGYNAAQSAKLLDTVRQRLSRLSAVRVMTLADAAPFGDFVALPNARFSAPLPQGDVIASVVQQRIGKTYFATLGVPLEQGREFTPQNENDDRNDSAVINETAARELFGSESPVGRRIRDLGENRNYTVIGVARDLKPGFMSTKPTATVYLALTLDTPPSIQGDVFEGLNLGNLGTPPGATIVIRGPAGADAIAAVRSELAAIDPHLTVFNVRTMREHIRQMNSIIAVSYVFYSGVGLFGLILACIGLAGVTAYAVAQRHKEIGIRMALGARSGQVLRLVLREGAALVAAGSVAGFVGAFFISRALSALTAELAQAFGATSRDPLLLIGAPLLLASLAMLACYLPARRATRIDPLAALRQE
jgi:putative ABC transport system permease protein